MVTKLGNQRTVTLEVEAARKDVSIKTAVGAPSPNGQFMYAIKFGLSGSSIGKQTIKEICDTGFSYIPFQDASPKDFLLLVSTMTTEHKDYPFHWPN